MAVGTRLIRSPGIGSMSNREELSTLKLVAKRVARARRVPHAEALDAVAASLGRPHWNALMSDVRNGWTSTEEDVTVARQIALEGWPDDLADRGFQHQSVSLDGSEHYDIDGHAFKGIVDTEVHLFGRGWHVHVGEAPSEEPLVEVTDRRIKKNPILDPAFVAKVLELAATKAQEARANIAADWPRRSTKPDRAGRAMHPLGRGLASAWYCLHCDGKFAASKLAANMWHCPDCGATPIDIFGAPFWLGPAPSQE